MSVLKIKNLDNLNLIESNDINYLFDYLTDYWSKKGCLLLGFVYFAIFARIKNDNLYKKYFEKYDFLLPDGIGIILYFKKTFGIDIPNLNGTDLLPFYIKYLESKNINYAFYGTTEENITLSAKKFNPYYFQNGFSELNFDLLKNNSVLFLGLGTPNQEIFIEKNIELIKEKSLMIVSAGGFFDFSSGNVKRAPLWIRKIKLEFLFRLIINPKQHFKKNLLNFLLVYFILKDRKNASKIK